MYRIASVLSVAFLAGAGCSEYSPLQEHASFDRFRTCVRDQVGVEDFDAAIRESCLQKYEELAEIGYLGKVTASLGPNEYLWVTFYSNPHEFLITSVEIAFYVPVEPDADCGEDLKKCAKTFLSARTWILPRERAEIPFYVGNSNSYDANTIKNNWQFQVNSVRLLKFE